MYKASASTLLWHSWCLDLSSSNPSYDDMMVDEAKWMKMRDAVDGSQHNVIQAWLETPAAAMRHQRRNLTTTPADSIALTLAYSRLWASCFQQCTKV
jgi:hypothetical protein